MKQVLFPCFIVLISLVYVLGVGQDAILLKNVERLVLQRGKYTTGRRSSPIPQLTCVGSSCYQFEPVTVICKNMGSDGVDATWECTSDMPRQWRFGTVNVQCEGYNFPDDPYILKGSCGLEYSIEPSGESSPSSSYSSYSSYNSTPSSGSTTFGTVFMFAVVCLIFYWIFRSCTDASRNHPNHGGGGGGGGFGNPPPPYGNNDNNNNNDGNSKPSSSSSSSSSSIPSSFTPNTAQGPGFWSGMLGGAALASMFRGRSQYGSGYGYNQGYNQGYGGFNRGYGGPSYRPTTSSFFSGGGGGSVERKSYGGTSRR